ncbi:MAG: SRPBCC family protein [Roseovarius sp.]
MIKSAERLQPGGGFQLPPEAYKSKAWFNREWREVFEPGWIFVGLVQEIPEKNSFKTFDLGPYPIIVTRDANGELYAMHNVCRHRVCQVASGSGKARSLVCPYHCWNYKLSGELARVPWKHAFEEFDLSEYGLRRLAVDTFWGMIFVHLNTDAEPLEDWLQGLEADVHEQGVRPQDLKLLEYREYEAGSNWKFIIENHVDCLHVPFLHAGSSNWKVDELFYGYCGPHHISHVPYDVTPENMKPLPGLAWKYPAFATNVIFPNVITIVWENVCSFMHVLPKDAKTSIWRWFILGQEGDNPANYLEFYEPVVLEDIQAGDMLQKTVASPRFEVGPMASFLEEPVAAFHDAYCDLMKL